MFVHKNITFICGFFIACRIELKALQKSKHAINADGRLIQAKQQSPA